MNAKAASNAANKAFITNRIGDAGFIVGMLIIWSFVGTFNFQEIFARADRKRRAHSDHYMLAGQIVPGSRVNRTTKVRTTGVVQTSARRRPGTGSHVALSHHWHWHALAPDQQVTEITVAEMAN